MSGNSEKIPDDFPACQNCLKNNFWTLKDINNDTIAHLIRNQYRGEVHIQHMVYFSYASRNIKKLDNATAVKCGKCGEKLYGDKLMVLVRFAKQLFDVLRPRFRT